MDFAHRLKNLMDERGLSIYALAQRSGLSWNTIKNIFIRETKPTVLTLEMLCKGLDITPAQFFDDNGDTSKLTTEQHHLLARWSLLTDDGKKVVSDMIDVMLRKQQ